LKPKVKTEILAVIFANQEEKLHCTMSQSKLSWTSRLFFETLVENSMTLKFLHSICLKKIELHGQQQGLLSAETVAGLPVTMAAVASEFLDG
jgi:hypothetical protein